MAKNKGSEGAKLGKKLLKECVKKSLNGEILTEPKYTADEFYTLSIEPNYMVWVNYHTIFTEYITRYNDYVASLSELEKAYFHILLAISGNYLITQNAFNCKEWKDDWNFQLFLCLLSDSSKNTVDLLIEAREALKTTLANIEYIRLYSLAFIGDESLSVPAKKYASVLDLHKKLNQAADLCCQKCVYPNSLPIISKANSDKLLKAFKDIDLTQRLAPGILISYTPDLLWKEDK